MKCRIALGKLDCKYPATWEQEITPSHGRPSYSHFYCGYCKRIVEKMGRKMNWYGGSYVWHKIKNGEKDIINA